MITGQTGSSGLDQDFETNSGNSKTSKLSKLSGTTSTYFEPPVFQLSSSNDSPKSSKLNH